MLFSQPELAAYMGESFECAWESIRDVPRVTIDLGEGRVVERTAGGNVMTWFCLPDGRAFDAQPGLLDETGYRLALEGAITWSRALRLDSDTLSEDERVERAHAYLVHDSNSRSWASWLAQTALVGSTQPGLVASPPFRLAALGELEAIPSFGTPGPPGFAGAASKTVMELPLFAPAIRGTGNTLGPVVQQPGLPPETTLQAETRWARETLRPRAHGYLSLDPLPDPRKVSADMYRLVMDIDVSDPWLGLRPFVLGRDDGFLDADAP